MMGNPQVTRPNHQFRFHQTLRTTRTLFLDARAAVGLDGGLWLFDGLVPGAAREAREPGWTKVDMHNVRVSFWDSIGIYTLYIYVYIYVYIYMYIYVYIYMYTVYVYYIYMYIYMYICIYMYMYIYIYMYICVCVCFNLYCIWIYLHVCHIHNVCVYIYIYIYIYQTKPNMDRHA